MSGGTFYGNQYTLDEELEYDYNDMVGDVGALATELARAPTTREAERDNRLPSIKEVYRLLGDTEWNDRLSDCGGGETQVGEYGPEDRPRIFSGT